MSSAEICRKEPDMSSESRETKLCKALIHLSEWLRESAAPRQESSGHFDDLSLRHLDVIRVVWTLQEENPEGTTLKRLAEELKLTPGTVSGLVDTLVKKGTLSRVQGKDDRRKVNISLTEESLRVIDRIIARMNETAKKLFSCLDEEEKNTLEAGFEKLNRRIKEIKNDKEEKK